MPAASTTLAWLCFGLAHLLFVLALVAVDRRPRQTARSRLPRLLVAAVFGMLLVYAGGLMRVPYETTLGLLVLDAAAGVGGGLWRRSRLSED